MRLGLFVLAYNLGFFAVNPAVAQNDAKVTASDVVDRGIPESLCAGGEGVRIEFKHIVLFGPRPCREPLGGATLGAPGERGSRAGPGDFGEGDEALTPQYKLSLVERADACATPGEIGRLLRRPGLYSSPLSAWWKAVRVDLGIRRRTFYGWYRRFKDRGVAGLADRHGLPARRRQGG